MRLISFLFYAIIFAIPFGLRKEIFSFIEGFQEYQTAHLYFTDILLIFLLILVFLYALFLGRGKYQISSIKYQINFKSQIQKIILMIFLLLAAESIFFAYSKGLALYAFVRLLLAVGLSITVAWGVRRRVVNLDGIFWSLGISGVFQSIIAFCQFAYQKSLGLWFLGESVLGANIPGVAKITIEGGKLIRAYGTMPHPNILAAFLVLGLLSFVYIWLRKAEKVRIYERVALAIGVFAIATGLILTFSRSGWIIAMLSVLVISGVLLYQIFNIPCLPARFAGASARRADRKYQKNGLEFKNSKRVFVSLLVILIFSALVNFTIFKDFILARSHISKTEVSVTQRLAYNEMALDIIKNNPWGVGIGNQVLYSVRSGVYQKFGMDKAWQWEPIHNIYLLIADEIGVLGIMTFFVFLLALLISNVQSLISKQHQISNVQSMNSNAILGEGGRGEESLKSMIVTIMLLALLMFGLVDHFLWTLWPGKLMLWLVIGIVMGVSEIEGAHSSMDRAQASEA